MEFYRNRKKSVNLILTYSGILALGILILIYSIGLFTDQTSTKGIAVSSIVIIVTGILVIKMLLALRDTSALLTLEPAGIVSKTTPVSKAAGLIQWKDIIGTDINKSGGDTLITLVINNPDHYIPIIRKKLSKLAVDGSNDANGNLLIYLSASELDIEAAELYENIKSYQQQVKAANLS